MKNLPLLATATLSLGFGIIIGRTSSSTSNQQGELTDENNGASSEYRSSRRGGSDLSDARRVGRVGGAPPESYINKVAHMRALAKKTGGNQGVPNFDALFGIWETAREMDTSEINLAISELEGAEMGMQEGMFVKMMLVMQLAKKNGPEAMAIAIADKNRSMVSMKEMALQSWSSSDPHEAYAWYLEHQTELNPRESKEFLASTLAAMAQTNFPDAFEKAKNVDSASQKQVLSQLGIAIVDNPAHRKQFIDYLMTIENISVQSRVAAKIAGQLALSDIKEATQLVDSWDGEDKAEMVNEVTRHWVQTHPEEAMNWQLSHAETESSIGLTFGIWSRNDSDAARKWLDGQEVIDDRDALRRSETRRTTRDEDYSGATKWADSIEDPTIRQDTYRHLYTRWVTSDKAGAEKWIETLDETTKKAVVPDSSNQ